MSGTGTTRPWQVWSYRRGYPRRVVRTYATRDAALEAAARWTATATRAGLDQTYAVRKRLSVSTREP